MAHCAYVEGLSREGLVALLRTSREVIHGSPQVCVEAFWKILNERVRAAESGRFADVRVVVRLRWVSERDIVPDLPAWMWIVNDTEMDIRLRWYLRIAGNVCSLGRGLT